MDSLKWLWGYVKKYKLSMLAILLLTALFIVCAFVLPIVLGRIVDDVIIGGNIGLLFFYCMCLIGFTIVRELVIYIRHLILENCSQGVIKAIFL